MCWHPLAIKLQRSPKMSDTPMPEETPSSGLPSHALFGWVACSDRLPDHFEMVFMRGAILGASQAVAAMESGESIRR